jgi:nitroreductase
METIINALMWREATKQFDTEKKLTDEELGTLLEAARLAPSSFGLQPWSFVVVSDPAVRTKLREASWDQPQVTDASELIVFAAKTPDDTLVDSYIADIAAKRGVTVESLESFSQMMKGSLAAKQTDAGRLEWAKRQAYIALGVTITSAALLGIDACPMEGFDPAKYDEILGLSAHGLHTAVILAVGHRAPTAAAATKVRFDKEKLVLAV